MNSFCVIRTPNPYNILTEFEQWFAFARARAQIESAMAPHPWAAIRNFKVKHGADTTVVIGAFQ